MKKSTFLAFALMMSIAFCSQAQSEIGNRQIEKHQRIHAGVQSGELTRHEQRTLNAQERGINNQVRAERAANGGRLTPRERRHANHELNVESRRIAHKKHNRRVR